MSDETFTITAAWIEKNASPRGGWTRAQLAAIGVPWPPPSKWKKSLVGTKIPKSRAAEFERLKT